MPSLGYLQTLQIQLSLPSFHRIWGIPPTGGNPPNSVCFSGLLANSMKRKQTQLDLKHMQVAKARHLCRTIGPLFPWIKIETFYMQILAEHWYLHSRHSGALPIWTTLASSPQLLPGFLLTEEWSGIVSGQGGFCWRCKWLQLALLYCRGWISSRRSSLCYS